MLTLAKILIPENFNYNYFCMTIVIKPYYDKKQEKNNFKLVIVVNTYL